MRRKILIIGAGLPALLLLGVVVHLAFSDLAYLRRPVASLLGDLLGTEVTVQGSFEAHLLSPSPRLAAGDVRVASAGGGAPLLRIDRIDVTVSLLSLLRGPALVRALSVEGAAVSLHVNAEGRASWDLRPGRPEDAGAGEAAAPPVAFEQVRLRDIELTYRGAPEEWDDSAPPRKLHVERLELTGDRDGPVELDLEARFRDAGVQLSGTASPLSRWVSGGRNVWVDLGGRFAGAEVSLQGQVAELAGLRHPDLQAQIQGGDLAGWGRALGMGPLEPGPFHAVARVEPRNDGVAVLGAAALPGMTGRLEGRLPRLIGADRVRLQGRIEGGDLSAAGALFGVADLPGERYTATGRLRLEAGRIELEGIALQAGSHRLALSGTVGTRPGLVGTDLSLDLSGDDLGALEGIAGRRLPRGEYRLSGGLVREEEAIRLEEVRAGMGGATVRLEGSLKALSVQVGGPDLSRLSRLAGEELPAAPFELEGTLRRKPGLVTLEAKEAGLGKSRFDGEVRLRPASFPAGMVVKGRASGPALSAVAALVGLEGLPRQRFDVEGKISIRRNGYELEGLLAKVGEARLEAQGFVAAADDLTGTDVRLQVRGEKLSRWMRAGGVEGAPAAPFKAGGRIRVEADAWRLDGVTGSLGDMDLALHGRLARTPDRAGTDLTLDAGGPDLSRLGPLAGLPGLPAAAFGIDGRLRIEEGAFRLEELALQLGEISGRIDGRLGPLPGLDGTDLSVTADGPDLSVLREWVELPPLPAEPFELSGGVRIREGVASTDGLWLTLGSHRLRVQGEAGPLPDLGTTELEARSFGPDLQAAGRWLAGAGVALPELPSGRYELSGRLRSDGDGWILREAALQLAGSRLSLDGRIGGGPGLVGTDLALDASGPDAGLLAGTLGRPLPPEPFRVQGRVGRDPERFLLQDLSLRLGELRLQADGVLGPPPFLAGSSLELRLEGPGLAPVRELAALPWLPDEPFRLQASLDDDGTAIRLDGLRMAAGESELEGSLRLRHRDARRLEASLTSRRLHVAPWMLGGEPEETATREESKPTGAGLVSPAGDGAREGGDAGRVGRLLIPDTPLPDVLRAWDAEVRWTAKRITGLAGRFHDAALELHLEDGRLGLRSVEASGDLGGAIRGRALLEPVEGEGYRLQAGVELRGVRFGLMASDQDPEHRPPLDLRAAVMGSGRTPHEIAAGSDGWVVWSQREGRIDGSALDIIGADVLRELFEALNPFDDEREYTELQCAVMVGRLEEGVLELDPIAARTDRVTVIGDGRIRFEDENLDLKWTAKPRKGIGLSASALTNPFVKLGGTLGDPSLTIKPVQSVLSTGAAVATGGLSFLAKGLWDRLTSMRKVCKRARKKARDVSEPLDGPLSAWPAPPPGGDR